MADCSLVTWVSGSNYVRANANVLPLTSSSYTFATWIMPQLTPGAAYLVMGIYDVTFTKLVRFNVNAVAAPLVEAYDSVNLAGCTSAVLNLNSWNHIAAVIGMSGLNVTSIRCYTNGTPGNQINSTIGHATSATNTGFYIGGQRNTQLTLGAVDIACKIAYPAIWNTALSGGQITNLQTLFPTSVAASNLVSYYPNSANTTDSIPDSGSNGWTLVASTVAAATSSVIPSLSAGGGASLLRFVDYYSMMRNQ